MGYEPCVDIGWTWPPSILNKITPTCRLKSKLRIVSHTSIWRCDRSEVLQVAALPPYKQRTRPEPWDQQEIVVHCNVSWWFKINSESTEKMYDDWWWLMYVVNYKNLSSENPQIALCTSQADRRRFISKASARNHGARFVVVAPDSRLSRR